MQTFPDTAWTPRLTRAMAEARKTVQFGVFGGIGGAFGSCISELVRPALGRTAFMLSVVHVGIWFGIIGACLAVALLAGHSYYLKRGVQLGAAAKHGALFGLLAGAVAGAIAQGVYRGIGPTEVLRVMCWGMAGGLLGYGLSFHLPNLGRQRGLLGGLIGGLLGGGLFLVCTVGLSNEVAGRLVGVTTIGVCIGLMIALIEAALREAWLDISYGPRETRTISLGPVPVSLGSDPACTIYAPSAPPVAARYTLEAGQILYEDVVAGRRASVSPGERHQIGSLTVTVCGGTSAATPVAPAAGRRPAQALTLQLASGQTLPLQEGTRLQVKDLPGLEAPAGDGVGAEVVRHPHEPMAMGLKNLSHRPWGATGAQGVRRSVEPGRSVRLEVGTRINFGTVEGEIQ